MRRLVLSLVVAALMLGIAGAVACGRPHSPEADRLFPDEAEITWVMINVNSRDQQGDAHLIAEKDGKAILIDAGTIGEAEKNLLPFLKDFHINHLAEVFITHPHDDHFGGLEPLLLADWLTIGHIYLGRISAEELSEAQIPYTVAI